MTHILSFKPGVNLQEFVVADTGTYHGNKITVFGHANYYHKFVKDHSKMVTPLINFLKKEKWKWTKQCQMAFEKLKEVAVSESVLSLTLKAFLRYIHSLIKLLKVPSCRMDTPLLLGVEN